MFSFAIEDSYILEYFYCFEFFNAQKIMVSVTAKISLQMVGLLVKDSLLINGSDGVHEIQLCFGDITDLPVKDKVDVVMVSAFPGDHNSICQNLLFSFIAGKMCISFLNHN